MDNPSYNFKIAIPPKEARDAKAREILRKALVEIRCLGLAPMFRWGTTPAGGTNGMAVNIDDFQGFLELPPGQ